jgi:hypothetical protein
MAAHQRDGARVVFDIDVRGADALAPQRLGDGARAPFVNVGDGD